MGKRPAASRSTRGVSKKKVVSSSSNPKTTKFRSQYSSAAISKTGSGNKTNKNGAPKKVSFKEAKERKKALNNMERVDMIHHGDVPMDADSQPTKRKTKNSDRGSEVSASSRLTNASLASVRSTCTNASLNEFFQVWNPKLETHKDALAVIAGLSQTISGTGTDQSDFEFTQRLIRIISTKDLPQNVLTGALLALTFVIRKLPHETLNDNFDAFYPILKELMEAHCNSKKKTLVKCLLKCFACLTKAHPSGKDALERDVRKKINLAVRKYKVQNKIKL